MITEIRLDNFKCIECAALPLGRLSLLLGKNSSGKSSIIQALLLLKQSLDEGSTPTLDLFGEYYPAGSFREIVKDHNLRLKLGLGLSYIPFGNEAKDPIASADWWFAKDKLDTGQLVDFWYRRGNLSEIWLESAPGLNRPQFVSRFRTGKAGRPKEISSPGLTTTVVPRLLLTKSMRQMREDKLKTYYRATNELFMLERIIDNIEIIGGYRDAPKRYYQFAGTLANTIKPDGSFAVHEIFRAAASRKLADRKFIRELATWLRRICGFRIARSSKPEDFARQISLRLNNPQSGIQANYAEVGFGVSQVLPLLVLGLRSPTHATLIFQQPELHLHPDAQLELADFFIHLADEGKQILVETHSEHMLLRMRRRMIERNIDKSEASKSVTENDISVHVFEQQASGSSSISTVTMDSLGQLASWPAGFMDQASQERLEILKTQTMMLEDEE